LVHRKSSGSNAIGSGEVPRHVGCLTYADLRFRCASQLTEFGWQSLTVDELEKVEMAFAGDGHHLVVTPYRAESDPSGSLCGTIPRIDPQ
jgi:hypothetical protein